MAKEMKQGLNSVSGELMSLQFVFDWLPLHNLRALFFGDKFSTGSIEGREISNR
jgi:hypothetical protein